MIIKLLTLQKSSKSSKNKSLTLSSLAPLLINFSAVSCVLGDVLYLNLFVSNSIPASNALAIFSSYLIFEQFNNWFDVNNYKNGQG